jgi:hypothetical protein
MYTMQQIRALYPNPLRWLDADEDDTSAYCVGGACVHLAGIAFRGGRAGLFPCTDTIAEALGLLNPRLHALLADFYANTISCANDDGRFETAWQTVEKALANQGEIPLDIDAQQWAFAECETD